MTRAAVQVRDERSIEDVPEKELLELCRKAVRGIGGLVYHTHDSRFSEKGFPDLTIVLHGRVIFAELKSEKGKVSLAQEKWLDELDVAGAEVYLWRPTDWANGEIERILLHGPSASDHSRWVKFL